MSEPATLADHIDEQSEAILALWRETVARAGDVPEVDSLSYAQFADHIPDLLDRLGDRLRGRPTDTTTEGKRHGTARWQQGYGIAEVVIEFSRLRTTLSRTTLEFAQQQHWDLARLEAVYRVINEVLDEAMAESVRQFQEASREETQKALAEVKTRQAAIEEAWVTAKLEKSKLRTVLNSLPLAVWVVDSDGTVIGVNNEAERLQIFAQKGDVGRVNVHHLGPENQILRPDHSSFPLNELPIIRALRGEPASKEELIWVIQGVSRIVSVQSAPLTDQAGTLRGAVAVVQDITQRIELERSLEQQRQLAEEASQHKTRLVSALSHDARTPLNAVVLAAQLLESHLDGGTDAEVQNCLRTIRHSVRNVLDLLGDLLNLSKIDAGATPAEISLFPIELVLAECLASIEPQARLKKLEVRLEPGPLANLSLETDRSKLKQILSNLLSNALRYTERGHIRIYGERTADQVRIAVEDTGIGINASDQGRIFDEFAVLDHPQRAEGGTGLGLAICRRLASLLNGEITLKSKAGVGSTFSLVLPNSALRISVPNADCSPGFESAAASHGAILVAEDHADSRQTLARVLRRMGYRVLEAGNGHEVIAIAKQEPILAVLMDVNMPLMDGIAATQALRADPLHRDLPIFALTGDVTLVNRNRIGEAGVSGYLEKPVTWDALKLTLGPLGNRPRTEGT